MNKIMYLASVLLLSIVATLAFTSCNHTEPEKTREVDGFSIIEIDSCEYIKTRPSSGYYALTHKGNCKFCAARNGFLNISEVAVDTIDHTVYFYPPK